MPPTAAATGSAARRGSRRSPATNSRLSSRPATKKKIASRPSAAQAPRVRSRCSAAGPTRVVAQRRVGVRPRRVGPDQGEHGAGQQQGAADGLLAQDVGDPAGLAPGATGEQRGVRGRRCGHRGRLRTSGVGWDVADQTSRRTGIQPTGRAAPGSVPLSPASPRRTPSSVCTVAAPRTPETSQTASAACRSATVPAADRRSASPPPRRGRRAGRPSCPAGCRSPAAACAARRRRPRPPSRSAPPAAAPSSEVKTTSSAPRRWACRCAAMLTA